MTQIVANGIHIEFETHGLATNPAMILCRGLGTQLIDWPASYIKGLVEAGLYVVTFDNRDVGLSQKFAGIPDISKILKGEERPPYTIFDMADDVVGLMNSMGIAKAHLFAISMGGMIGQVVAATYGERLLTLFSVMSSSSRRGLPGATPEASATLNAETNPDANAQEIIAATVHGLEVCGSPGYPLEREALFEIAQRRYDRDYTPGGGARQMAAIFAAGSRIPLLEQIKVPTMVIHGKDDPLIPVAAGKDTAQTIPGARLEVVPGMGHDLPPALVPHILEIVLGFIAQQD
jgi:pimeloyl-ACP methyl ester carboxylesterase